MIQLERREHHRGREDIYIGKTEFGFAGLGFREIRERGRK
jgi:hypothetical protein